MEDDLIEDGSKISTSTAAAATGEKQQQINQNLGSGTGAAQKCLAYSANWYQSEIGDFNEEQDVFAFGSNNSIFIMSYLEKKYLHMITLSNNNNSGSQNKEKERISCVRLIDQKESRNLLVLCGTSSGNVHLYELLRSTNGTCSARHLDSHRATGNDAITLTHYDAGENSVYVCCSSGEMFSLEIHLHHRRFNSFTRISCDSSTSRSTQHTTKQPQQQQLRVKKMVFIEDMILLFFDNQLVVHSEGKVVFSQNFAYKILAIDTLTQQQQSSSVDNPIRWQFALLVKNKQQNILSILLEFEREVIQMEEKQIKSEESSDKSADILAAEQRTSFRLKEQLSTELFFIYSKKQNTEGSCFSLHCLSEESILITGKIGDMYVFDVNRLRMNAGKKISINPMSAPQFVDPIFMKVADSNHYNGIFALLRSKNKVISVSIDRRISFFAISVEATTTTTTSPNKAKSISFEWQLNCLGGKVTCITTSHTDKELVLMSCLDSTLRVWDSQKSLYVKEYYKRLDNLRVTEILAHPTDERMVLLRVDNNAIVGYDMLKEGRIFEYRSNRDILYCSWVDASFVEEISNIQFASNNVNESSVQDEKSKQMKVGEDEIAWLNKKANENVMRGESQFVLLVFKKMGYMSIIDVEGQSIVLRDYLICEKKSSVQMLHVSSINSVDEESNQLFIVFAQQGNITLYADNAYKYFESAHKNVVKSIACKSKYEGGESLVTVCCASLDRRISVFRGSTRDVNSFVLARYLKHEYPIERVRFAQQTDSLRMLAIAATHSTLQVYDLSCIRNSSSIDKPEEELEGNEEEQENHEEIKENTIIPSNHGENDPEFRNIRGHTGYINDAVFLPLDHSIVVSSADDQTVKFWDLNEIPHKSYPKRKKNGNKNKNAEAKQQGTEKQSTKTTC